MLYLLGLDLWTSQTAGLPDLTCLSIGELIPHSSFIDIRYAHFLLGHDKQTFVLGCWELLMFTTRTLA